MGHAQHGHAFVSQLHHDVKHFIDHFRIKCGRRFVEQHDLRLHGKRSGDGDTLLLTAGKLRWHLGGLGSHAHAGKQIHGEILGRLLIHVAHLDRRKRHVFKNGLVGEQVERLEHHADLGTQAGELLAFLGQWLAINANITGINGFQTVDGAAHRGLAGTGWTDDDQHLALLDGEVDVLEHMQVTVVLFNVGQFDQRAVAVFRTRHDRARLLRFFDICHTDSI